MEDSISKLQKIQSDLKKDTITSDGFKQLKFKYDAVVVEAPKLPDVDIYKKSFVSLKNEIDKLFQVIGLSIIIQDLVNPFSTLKTKVDNPGEIPIVIGSINDAIQKLNELEIIKPKGDLSENVLGEFQRTQTIKEEKLKDLKLLEKRLELQFDIQNKIQEVKKIKKYINEDKDPQNLDTYNKQLKDIKIPSTSKNGNTDDLNEYIGSLETKKNELLSHIERKKNEKFVLDTNCKFE